MNIVLAIILLGIFLIFFVRQVLYLIKDIKERKSSHEDDHDKTIAK